MYERTKLIFIQHAVKTDSATSHINEVLVSKHFLPAIWSVVRKLLTFQQENAPSHQAREMVEYLDVSANSTGYIKYRNGMLQQNFCC